MGLQPWLRLGEKEKQKQLSATQSPLSFNTFVINSLGPCSREWTPPHKNLYRELRPIARCENLFFLLQNNLSDASLRLFAALSLGT